MVMWITRDLILVICYKLRMFHVPLDRPSDIMYDNQGVVNNTSLPQYTLGKKHYVLNYHVVREAAEAGILREGKEDMETNLADLFKNILGYTHFRRSITGG